jgi:hypothetical protein
MGLYAPNVGSTHWMFNVATGLYAIASASGSLYFVSNFGTEGKSSHLPNYTRLAALTSYSQLEHRLRHGHLERALFKVHSKSTWHFYGIGVPL